MPNPEYGYALAAFLPPVVCEATDLRLAPPYPFSLIITCNSINLRETIGQGLSKYRKARDDLRYRLSSGQIHEKFGCRIDAGNQQMVAGSGGGDIEQVALGIVDLFEIRLVDSTEAAPAALPALLARFNSRSLRVKTPISSGGTPSPKRSANHSPTATASRSVSAKVSMMGSMPLKAEIVPPRLSALSSATASTGRYPTLRKSVMVKPARPAYRNSRLFGGFVLRSIWL